MPGPFCEAAGLTADRLKRGDVPADVQLSNGMILELFAFQTGEKLGAADFLKLLQKLNDSFNGVTNPNVVINKINRLLDQKKKITHRKKVKGDFFFRPFL